MYYNMSLLYIGLKLLLKLSIIIIIAVIMKKALKCKPSAELGRNIGIFGLKTPSCIYIR